MRAIIGGYIVSEKHQRSIGEKRFSSPRDMYVKFSGVCDKTDSRVIYRGHVNTVYPTPKERVLRSRGICRYRAYIGKTGFVQRETNGSGEDSATGNLCGLSGGIIVPSVAKCYNINNSCDDNSNLEQERYA